MNVVQNYLFSIIKGHFSLYEVRIFTRIVLQANRVLKGKKFSHYLGQSIATDGINCNIGITIDTIITDGSHNYQAVIDAAKSLQDKVVEFYDRRTSKYVYHRDHLINNVCYVEGSGVLTFTVSEWLLQYILNFIDSNFSMYDFENCLTLSSTYSVRMYWLFCSMSRPVTYRLSMLREMLGCQNKYSSNKDFIKRCIEPARKELEEKNLNGFSFTKKGRGEKVMITFSPVKRQSQTKEQLTAYSGNTLWVSPIVRNYLLNNVGFSKEELLRNKATLTDFCQVPLCEEHLYKIVQRARRKNANKGYIIAAMKNVYKEEMGTKKNEMSRTTPA